MFWTFPVLTKHSSLYTWTYQRQSYIILPGAAESCNFHKFVELCVLPMIRYSFRAIFLGLIEHTIIYQSYVRSEFKPSQSHLYEDLLKER